MDWLNGLCNPSSNAVMQNGQTRDVSVKANGGDNSVASWIGCCDPKSPVAIASNMGQSQGNDERAGVGIILALNPDGSLYVHTVCAASSAEGQLYSGDILMRIGEEDVFRAPAPHVAELLLGDPGTEVAVTVRRSINNDGGPPFTNHVMRMPRKRTDPELARSAIRQAFEDHNASA